MFSLPTLRAHLLSGHVIPAHPLALTADRMLDERRQRALTRYYADAGAGGIAVAVHTTQFEIHRPDVGLFKPVLRLAIETARACETRTKRPLAMIAGIIGTPGQALWEAKTAAAFGYDAGMLSLGAMRDAGTEELLAHCRRIAAVIPLVGFYLQPAVGGRVLGYGFWRRFADIENVVAIKVAPFNRYQTLDVVRAVADAGRAGEIALYTGNDDSIVSDLLAGYRFGETSVHFSGGLLGQWAVWTQKAVELLDEIKTIRSDNTGIPPRMLTLATQLTDANGAIFDARHNFAGCIPGIHDVLRRQGLLENILCVDPDLALSPLQADEITRVSNAYPWLTDDDFVRAHLAEWLD
ncbi:MAG: dihydrodipicolinate synthase family protein [Ignavibacteria bacterium]|nr:dihydrodipicolinate synthase family protein [Ignavibacteria bacterium]